MKIMRVSDRQVYVTLTREEMAKILEKHIKPEGFKIKKVRESLHFNGFIIRAEKED